MELSEVFFLAIVFYLLYRFVFNFLVPVARTTRHVRQQFRNMQEMQDGMRQQMQDGMRQQQGPARPQQSQQRPAQRPPAGDYIDFEEVKE
ncbi:MAG TPA: DUF4834 family protein [Puia sp.]|nr:DUF4834 family protein [Puia sp.]